MNIIFWPGKTIVVGWSGMTGMIKNVLNLKLVVSSLMLWPLANRPLLSLMCYVIKPQWLTEPSKASLFPARVPIRPMGGWGDAINSHAAAFESPLRQAGRALRMFEDRKKGVRGADPEIIILVQVKVKHRYKGYFNNTHFHCFKTTRYSTWSLTLKMEKHTNYRKRKRQQQQRPKAPYMRIDGNYSSTCIHLPHLCYEAQPIEFKKNFLKRKKKSIRFCIVCCLENKAQWSAWNILNGSYSGGWHFLKICFIFFITVFFVMPAYVNICRVHSLWDVQNPLKSGSCIHTIVGKSNVRRAF